MQPPEFLTQNFSDFTINAHLVVDNRSFSVAYSRRYDYGAGGANIRCANEQGIFFLWRRLFFAPYSLDCIPPRLLEGGSSTITYIIDLTCSTLLQVEWYLTNG